MIYFYENPYTGKIIDCDERTAYTYQNIHRWKQLGVSDGKAYREKVRKIHEELHELFNRVQFDKENGLTTPKTVMLRFKKAGQEEKDICAKAWDEELEIARGNFQRPPDDRLTIIGGNAEKLRNIMHGRME